MRPIRYAAPILLCALAAQADAHARTRYLELVNRARDSVVSVAVTDGSGSRELPIGEPLRGGGASTTLQIDGEGCRYELRVTYLDGSKQRYPDLDLCRQRSLHLRPSPRAAAGQGG
ncbi:hypothetical protein [Lysobacter silvisoli]|uniref:Uncharacterized protein n=1 Tax=Lysobacter silvisoli TaxID=2293254 RepID=A0A371K381_9GAMM|nr:hypothetical protein [Lysobacter silvisoli]RDZ28332.1 hypothetical protein DX914_04115 [Lysobacter silvisoli]